VLPNRYDDIVFVSFNGYAYFAEKLETGGEPDWRKHLRVDDSVSCVVAGVSSNGVIAHPCQSEGGASGAPLLRLSVDEGSVDVVGVLTGGFSRLQTNTDYYSAVGVDTSLVPNRGAVVDERLVRILAGKIGTVSAEVSP
jgi:hypothetical protein